MPAERRIAISPGSVVTTLLILLGAYLLWVLRDLALLVLTAIVISSAIEPGIAFFVRYRLPRFFATLLMYVIVLGSAFALVYFFFPPILADAAGFLSEVPQYLNTLQVPSAGLAQASNLLGGSHEAESLLSSLAVLQSALTANGSGVVDLVATFFGGIFSLILVVVLSFYFALSDTGVDDFLRLVIPAAYEEYAVDLWRRSQRKIGRWMQGQILLSVIVGVLVYLGLLILSIPYALLLAVFTAFAEIIPIFGSLMAGGAAAAVAYTAGGFPLALIVAGLYVVVNQFEANLIYPLIVKKVVGIPPLLVIVALIAGWTLAGFLGVLLSVPVAAAALEFLSDYGVRKRREHKNIYK
ncbi:MAG: AI-2E family transporter [Patescibacteria group bacterium]|nr:AI-2E family transporter [Patescibacteria group bacterium]MDE1944295.1 AI-2E family transporter [Patescibacteria group bacterium]MDE1944782.1 AI-2E family transporter [Patescibacteria group bacterium]MDE2057235.1 AI-2E family transporter [Patescibacteria group bacterium]